jgi:hypothetical protein
MAPLTAEQLRSVDANATALRFNRGRSVGGRFRALDELHDILVNDAHLYQGSLQDKRDAVVQGIQAVINFFGKQMFAGATLESLNRPILALVERESNRSDPMFERARSGAPKRSLATEHQTGAIAALADEWLRMHLGVGQKTEVKLRALARELSGPFFERLTYAKVKGARELARQEATDHPAVCWANFYRKQLADASIENGATQCIPDRVA